jgi:flavin reductase (DIM6/NTAB) family NADH-FMN oxidoreductase RutF
MLKVVAENTGAFYQHYPRAATIVTANHNGRKNAMAVAWHCPVSFNPPYYGVAISPKRYTYHMIAESGQFGINFIPYDKVSLVAAVGGSSGSYTDKFTEFNLTEDSSIKLDVPILRDAYVAYECKVIESRVFGDHAWMIGEILASHTAGNLLKEDGTLDLSVVKPTLYLGGDTYCSTDGGSAKFLDKDEYGKK